MSNHSLMIVKSSRLLDAFRVSHVLIFSSSLKSNKHLASAWLFRIELLAAPLTQQESDPQGRFVSLVETRIFQHGMAIARNFPNAAYSFIEEKFGEYRVLDSDQLSLSAA